MCNDHVRDSRVMKAVSAVGTSAESAKIRKELENMRSERKPMAVIAVAGWMLAIIFACGTFFIQHVKNKEIDRLRDAPKSDVSAREEAVREGGYPRMTFFNAPPSKPRESLAKYPTEELVFIDPLGGGLGERAQSALPPTQPLPGK